MGRALHYAVDGTVATIGAQEQKLETMGRLIAGIAHELSSPMQFIAHSAEYLRAACEGPADGRQEIDQAINDVLTGVAQATHILRAMKQLSHPGSANAYAVDLNEAVEGAALVARASVRRVADLTLELGTLPPVVCHPSAVRQAVVNLLINAADAVEEACAGTRSRRGRVGVRTRLVGDEAVISVSDSGTGIPDDVRERIFEPFFTTKPADRGSGQGLAIVRDIIDQHGGGIDLCTAEGRGTTFTLRIPVRGPAAAVA